MQDQVARCAGWKDTIFSISLNGMHLEVNRGEGRRVAVMGSAASPLVETTLAVSDGDALGPRKASAFRSSAVTHPIARAWTGAAGAIARVSELTFGQR